MRNCFEQGKIREYWESDLELEKWFDPAFEDFINNEIVRKTSPKQKMQNLKRIECAVVWLHSDIQRPKEKTYFRRKHTAAE